MFSKPPYSDGELYDRYYQRIFSIAFTVARDSHDAQDIVQDTFLKIFQKKKELKEVNNLDAWVYTVTKRTALDHIRKRNILRERTVLDDSLPDKIYQQSDTTDHQILANETKDEIKKIVEQLSDKLYEVIVLRYIYEFRPIEIATIINVNEQIVHNRLHQAKKKLQKKVISRNYAHLLKVVSGNEE